MSQIAFNLEDDDEQLSSCFSRLSYDSNSKNLIGTFKNSGATYRWTKVPMELAIACFAADSRGRAFQEFISGQFQSERL